MEQHEIAKYAVDAYSYLLPANGTYTPQEFVSLIRAAYKMDARREAECEAVERCVLKIVKHYGEIRTKIIRR